eukprot:Gb_15686 [translate_table: standard]
MELLFYSFEGTMELHEWFRREELEFEATWYYKMKNALIAVGLEEYGDKKEDSTIEVSSLDNENLDYGFNKLVVKNEDIIETAIAWMEEEENPSDKEPIKEQDNFNYEEMDHIQYSSYDDLAGEVMDENNDHNEEYEGLDKNQEYPKHEVFCEEYYFDKNPKEDLNKKKSEQLEGDENYSEGEDTKDKQLDEEYKGHEEEDESEYKEGTEYRAHEGHVKISESNFINVININFAYDPVPNKVHSKIMRMLDTLGLKEKEKRHSCRRKNRSQGCNLIPSPHELNYNLPFSQKIHLRSDGTKADRLSLINYHLEGKTYLRGRACCVKSTQHNPKSIFKEYEPM